MPTPTAGYSGTPLPRKLGVKEGTRLSVIDAPPGFVDGIQPLPFGAEVVAADARDADVIVAFVTRHEKLPALIARQMKRMPADGGMLWIAWPKKAAKVETTLSFDIVQHAGLDAGLVDTKICAIDATWSGLRFSRRRKPGK